MILPYSTDAPIYYFPWMTILLIVVNGITFALTGMGWHSDGWLLQYGNGLHPTEWLAYSFLHFGPLHLIGNMFFLWAFGIVVEGKLGWWKFLALYLSIGITGGALIQIAMLGYRPPLDAFAQAESAPVSWFDPPAVMAQEFPDIDSDAETMDDVDAAAMDDAGIGNVEGVGEEERALTPEEEAELRDHLHALQKPGAGGASLIVFALLGIVLVWAPKNEVTCFFLMGFRAGTFEIEYLYFCGFKIFLEIVGMVMGVRGFEVTSEVGHVIGAVLGFGAGTLFLKMDWVDCENWDLFAYLQNKHGSMVEVGSWQNSVIVPGRRAPIATPEDEEDSQAAAPRKKRAKSKLVALESFDDEPPDSEAAENPEPWDVEEPTKTESVRPQRTDSATRGPKGGNAGVTAPLDRIRAALKKGDWATALAELRRQRTVDRGFELPRTELNALADGFFKAHNVRDSRPLLEESIRRFPDQCDRQRIKLAVLYVRFLNRPTAGARLLAAVDQAALPDDYQVIYRRAAQQAQQMISEGIIDAG